MIVTRPHGTGQMGILTDDAAGVFRTAYHVA